MTNQYGSTNPYGSESPQPSAPTFQQPYGQPPAYGVLPTQATPMAAPKSKVLAAVLAFFFGGFGAHNFYLGYNQRGGIQLALYLIGWVTSFLIIGFVAIFGVGIWALVEFIMILAGSDPYRTDARGIPLD